MSIFLTEKPYTAESYRIPLPVMHLRRYGDSVYSVCPRCCLTLEREYQIYCDRCGQRLGWELYGRMVIVE